MIAFNFEFCSLIADWYHVLYHFHHLHMRSAVDINLIWASSYILHCFLKEVILTPKGLLLTFWIVPLFGSRILIAVIKHDSQSEWDSSILLFTLSWLKRFALANLLVASSNVCEICGKCVGFIDSGLWINVSKPLLSYAKNWEPLFRLSRRYFIFIMPFLPCCPMLLVFYLSSKQVIFQK